MQESPHPRSLTFRLWIAAALTAAVVVLLDQYTKAIFFAKTTGIVLIPNLLETIHHENHGIVANVPLPLPITVAMTIIIMIILAAGVTASVRMNDLVRVIALAEIFGGALGNLADRLSHGFVFDWILLFGQSAINIADLAIIEGAIVYVGWLWLEKKRKEHTLVF